MAVPAQDGAWLSLVKVTRLDCSICGTVITTKYPTNDREDQDLIAEHLRKHNGRWLDGNMLRPSYV